MAVAYNLGQTTEILVVEHLFHVLKFHFKMTFSIFDAHKFYFI